MEADSLLKKFCNEFGYQPNDFVPKQMPNNVVGYFYKTKLKQSTISYYVIPRFTDNKEDFKTVHKRIWSENQADIYITISKDGGVLYYAKTLPEDALSEDIKIDDFSYGLVKPSETQKKYQKYEALKKIGVDSGLFAEFHRKRLKEIQDKKKKTVDQALINTIDYLKEHVSEYISIKGTHERKEIIQALIDRSIFIKFLEDKGLLTKIIYNELGSGINSYADILKRDSVNYLNMFFELINKKFNGDLFKEPKLEEKYFSEKSLIRILELFIKGARVQKDTSGSTVAQLPLFDYEFNVIPVELLSSIYESFLEEERRAKGIYYTPDPIVDIVLNDTLDEYLSLGNFPITILDPSCGSGTFLVRAFKRLIEHFEGDKKRLSFTDRATLLRNCIFGIDNDNIATRITVFSLYLALIEGLDDGKYALESFEFPKLLNKNIIIANSLDVNHEEKIIFKNSRNESVKNFDLIIGNPPWGGIKSDSLEYEFVKMNRDKICDNEFSQAFMVQVPSWADQNTHFGFVIKGTNFINIQNAPFKNFFFSNFILEKYYDLTKVRDFIFKKGKFSVSIIIFRLKKENEGITMLSYYRPVISKTSKDLKILFLENEKIELQPNTDVSTLFIRLLSGNKSDMKLIEKIENYPKIKNIFEFDMYQGLIIKDKREFKKNIVKMKNIGETEYLTNKLLQIYHKLIEHNLYEDFINETTDFNYLYERFIEQIVSKSQLNKNYSPLIKPENVENYKTTEPVNFIDYGPWLGMPRKKSIFEGSRIYIRETIKKPYRICAAYLEDNSPTTHNFVFKIDEKDSLFFFLALFNSLLASYYLSFTSPRYATKQNPTVNEKNLKDLPYPSRVDSEVLGDIIKIAKVTHDLANKASKNNDLGGLIKSIEHKYCIEEVSGGIFYRLLNIQDELIFEFYGLNGKERQRIKDFFISEDEEVNGKDLERYADTFKNILSPYLVEGVDLYHSIFPKKGLLDFVAIAFILDGENFSTEHEKNTYNTVIDFIGDEFVRDKEVSFIPGGQFKIYQNKNKSLFVIKSSRKRLWSRTKALEDATNELEKIRDAFKKEI